MPLALTFNIKSPPVAYPLVEVCWKLVRRSHNLLAQHNRTIATQCRGKEILDSQAPHGSSN